MIFLSNAALRYAVEICAEVPKYQVIVTALVDKRLKIQEDLIDLVNRLYISEVHWIKNSYNRAEIYLKNGSHITVVPASDSARGYREHLLIVDKDINPKVIKDVFIHKEILDWDDYEEYHRKKEKETL